MTSGEFTTQLHEDLREQARAFAESVVLPRVAQMEESRAVDAELARAMARQGWMAVTVGRRYGGMELGHLAKVILTEEVSRVSGAAGAILQASQLGVAKIQHFGTDRQKSRWLPAISSGACLPTIAVTEADSGGWVLGMSATARRDGDGWVLNGRKTFVGNSHIGDLHGVVVRTGEGNGGLSAFLVESERPGLSLGEYRPAMGLHGFSFGELIFDNCRVPDENLIGGEGGGLSVALSSSTLYGRLNLAAVAFGIHRALVENSARFLAQQQRYGRPLSALGAVQQKLGAMQSRLMTAQLTLYYAAHLLDRGLSRDALLFNAKLVNVELLLDSARTAMEVHGARSLFPDQGIERHVRDAFHLFAPAGTSDVQRLRLAEFALGQSKGEEWSHQFAAANRQYESAMA